MSEFSEMHDVLIVGAGPVGLALATELAMRGHSVFVAERNDRTGVQPRAKTTNVRSMTHMRRWGLAGEIRKRAPLREGFRRRVRFATGLFGHDIHYFDNAFCAEPARDDRFPENAEFIPQYIVEGVLHDHAAAHPLITLSMGTRFDGFTQDDQGVTAQLADVETGATRRVRARYMVGADGGRSAVRDQLEIAMRGDFDMVSFVTLILRIPGLVDDPELNEALFHWIIDPAAPSILGPMDKADLWYWSKAAPRSEPSDTETMLDFVRSNIGKPYEVEVLARDDWTVHGILADRYREGRVFLAGDACHLHSPFGGHGMNQGIGDAVDLGWKLAAALEGWGGEALLDSYQFERRQMHEHILRTASENVATLSDFFAAPDLMADSEAGIRARATCADAIETAKAPEFHSLGLVLGFRYEGSAINAEEPGPLPPLSVTEYTPSARPGFIAPHAWRADGTSLYDSFGLGYALLRLGPSDAALEKGLLDAATEIGLPLTVVSAAEPDLRALYGADYALVRPDQHIAWRGDSLDSPRELLDRLRGQPVVPA
ncbi:MAG: NAD(P)-binding protein [Rhodobacteraceae bacterium]|nr:NAD(P)-binding protein [Paracoccaceae bacterium]MBR9821044.1 NAD(P)-binding protein [Paracoccaceae bacterium]